MSKTLLLHLASPLQSWGIVSKYSSRRTHFEPTKSGVVGLLAAASGRRRTDPIEDLVKLRFGVRVDKPGELIRDFHTVSRSMGDKKLPTANGDKLAPGVSKLTERYYLSDAIFLVALEGEDDFIEYLSNAIQRPTFPLFLGRRSCPPSRPVFLKLVDACIEEAFEQEAWSVSIEMRKKSSTRVTLPYSVDDPLGLDSLQDVPISFDPVDRQYGWRNITRGLISTINPDGNEKDRGIVHNPFSLLVED